jgi:hypothetical protein
MRHGGFGFVALGRLLAVECYRESHQPSPAHPLRGSGVDRTAGNAPKPDPGNAGSSRAPARPQHG